jgi:hypothetical protein
MSKKIKKTVAKFDLGHQFAKKLGLPDPAGDLIYGDERALSPEEKAAKAAENVGSVAAPDAAPTAQDPQSVAAREDQKRKQAAYAGLSSNVMTKPGGLSGGANTQLKSLLGS